MNNNFSENIKKIRKDNKLSQEGLAAMLGVSRQAISKWESKEAYPEMDKIISICQKFDVNIDDLLNKDIKEVNKEKESKRKLNDIFNDVLSFITDSINMFFNVSLKTKLKCIFEELILILFLVLTSLIIYSIFDSILYRLLSFISNYRIIKFITSIFESLCLVFLIASSIIILVQIFNTRYLKYYRDATIDESNKNTIEVTNKKIIIREPKDGEYHFISGLFKLIIGIIKIFTLFIILGISLCIICLFSLLVLSFTIIKTGLLFIGLFLFILSVSTIFLILQLILLNFIFNRKNNNKLLIYTFIISVVVIGISVGLMFIGSLKFKIVSKSDYEKVYTNTIKMRDNLYIYNIDNIEFIESNNDDIKIVCNTNKLVDVNINVDHDGGVFIEENSSNYIKVINEFIKYLNKKEFITFDSDISDIYNIKVYTSSNNIKKIKSNYNKLDSNY